MKNFFIMTVLLSLAATPAMAVTVAGSKHDMIASGFAAANNGAASEVCIFCHTPHAAQTSVTQAPLWNNSTEDATTFYDSDYFDFTTSAVAINATDARLCLACHDGSVSLPINGPNVGDFSLAGAMSASATLGVDMSNDHPIGMDLGASPETTDLQGSIRPLATIRTNFGNVDPFFGGDPDAPDNINFMWCSSCHDVHDNANVPFLRITNVGSNLCKACHEK